MMPRLTCEMSRLIWMVSRLTWVKSRLIWMVFVSFCFVFVALRRKSTAMVIAGRSVHLTTLFPGQA